MSESPAALTTELLVDTLRRLRAQQGSPKEIEIVIARPRRRPVPANQCQGRCGGSGRVACRADDPDPVYRMLWYEAAQRWPCSDGLQAVICVTCAGTGRKLNF